MDIGMLWYDDDKKSTLDSKIERAAQYYLRKYGVRPTDCYVHKSAIEGSSSLAGGLRVRVSGTVIKNHMWLGVSDN